MRRAVLTAVLLALAATSACAQSPLDELLKRLPQGSTPGAVGDVRIGQALKQALEVATDNAVRFTGRADGYFKNAAIKILMPEKLRTLERGLRAVGYDQQIDQFVESMNRAAERAAPAARTIFFDAIGDMTIDDARRILDGAETAATDYFRGKTTDRLTTAFGPVVQRAMGEVGVTRQYQELFGYARSVPFLKVEDFDLDRYVVGKALDGLFLVVADEEKKIRRDPAARVTDLLREVFGSRR